MIENNEKSVPYLQFPNLQAFSSIRHGIFTREGGVSKTPYNSLNVGLNTGDQKENVIQNRRTIRQNLGDADMVFAHQIHGKDVLMMENNNLISHESRQVTQKGDAIVTNVRGKNLVIQVADCQAVLLYDPVKEVIGNVHSGWRGSVLNIVGETISVMKCHYGSETKDIFVGVGPSLGPCCAEFINYPKEIPESLWIYKRNSVYFDFWSLTRDQLMDAGVLKKNIYIADICTKCNTDRFFSYRDQQNTGRFAVAIGLR